jgi:hypothetical protein
VADAEWYDRRHTGEQRLWGRRTVGAYLAKSALSDSCTVILRWYYPRPGRRPWWAMTLAFGPQIIGSSTGNVAQILTTPSSPPQ